MKHNLLDLEPTARNEGTQTKYGSHLDVSLPNIGSPLINEADGIISRRCSSEFFITRVCVGAVICTV